MLQSPRSYSLAAPGGPGWYRHRRGFMCIAERPHTSEGVRGWRANGWREQPIGAGPRCSGARMAADMAASQAAFSGR